ncbi:MAG: hypothetical protein LIP02_07150, partial [Bacteroidales bacterium]|nr:hypothetical protein [Bacteroidales bacterium]
MKKNTIVAATQQPNTSHNVVIIARLDRFFTGVVGVVISDILTLISQRYIKKAIFLRPENNKV